MKKFVSILTVVAMVAALCTSAFAANSPTNPLEPGQIVEPDPGDFNVPDPGDDTPSTPATEPAAPAAEPAAPAAEAPAAAPAAAAPAAEAPAAAPAAETAAGGSTQGGTSTTPTTTDASTQSPTAKLEDYVKESLAYIMTSLLLDTTKVITSDELIAAMGVKAPFNFTIASNPLAMKDAKGVKKTKLANGKFKLTVGQNQVTEGKPAEDLFAIVAPAKVDEKAEVADIALDDAGNMEFETAIDEGAFTIGMKAE